MGRGRAKAKQAKVARQLKYSGASTDLDALRKELLSGAPAGGVEVDDAVDDDDADEYDDEYAEPDSDEYGDHNSYGAGGSR